MDELLRTPRQAGLPEQLRAAEEKLQNLTRLVRERSTAVWETLRTPVHTVQDWAERHPISPLLFLSVSFLAGVLAVLSTIYTTGYVVSLNGEEIGLVGSAAVYAQAQENVERRAAFILGDGYDLSHSVSLVPALSERSAGFTSMGEIEAYLSSEVGEIMKGYVLTVDGKTIGAADEETTLTGMLYRVSAPYRTEETVKYGFVEDVQISSDYITSDYNQDIDDMFATLTENINGETTYEVVSGDTYYDIAWANGMSLDELMALNPQASLNSLFPGDVLNVKKIIPYLSVYTVDRLSYEAPVPSPIEYVDDPSMYVGNTKVITQGEDGRAWVTADVTYINGYETEREVLESTALVEPTVTVIAQGTTPRPKTASTGTYQWPIYGVITSRFGGRSLYGSYDYHLGLDIATYYGAPVKAADGGLVTYSGWKGSYGKLIIVTHDNGVKTYYAHNSSLAVSVGQRVYQGQVVAYAGSTGNSTGVHCHFGVVVNGSYVNPLNYLP